MDRGEDGIFQIVDGSHGKYGRTRLIRGGVALISESVISMQLQT
jgi:hypothetical protein